MSFKSTDQFVQLYTNLNNLSTPLEGPGVMAGRPNHLILQFCYDNATIQKVFCRIGQEKVSIKRGIVIDRVG